MNLFTDPKKINPGDEVFHEYDGLKAYGTVKSVSDLLEVDFTTEQSTEPKIEKFREGFWKKEIL